MARRKLNEFSPMPANPNRHTQRGMGQLADSIRADGYGAAMTAAANGEVFDGNARLETVADVLGLDVEPIIVRSDGTRPVIHVREDIPDASDPRARRLAYAANRAAEVNLSWDPEVLAADLDAGLDLSGLWRGDELDGLLEGLDLDIENTGSASTSDGSLLALIDVTIAPPRHKVEHGEVWLLGGRHTLIICKLIREWSLWAPHLRGGDTWFVPYPGVLSPLIEKADAVTLVMVQPDPYLAGHLLDRYEDIHGAGSVARG